MSGIQILYQEAVKKIEEWEDSHSEEEATPAIIASNLRYTSSKVGILVRQGVLPEIINILVEEYGKIGWNPKLNRATGSSPPTFEVIKECYKQIYHRVEEYTGTLQNNVIDNELFEVTEEEVSDVTAAGQKLWSLDINRLTPAPSQKDLDENPHDYHYLLNLQRYKSFHDKSDQADGHLFAYVNPSVWEKPTFSSFIAILDNYEPHAGINEDVTHHEIKEMNVFLDACIREPVMKYTFNWLIKKKILKPNATIADFKKLLHDLWFNLYSRGRGAMDSSGFEHVFVGEIKNEKVVGLHNWIQIYHEEKRGTFDYKGFIKPKGKRGGRKGIDSYTIEMLQNVSFSWLGYAKDSSTIFVGTSPEFELALYTISFYHEGHKDIFHMGPYEVEITAYDYIDRRTNTRCIGTSFPALCPMTIDEATTKIQAAFRGKLVRSGK